MPPRCVPPRCVLLCPQCWLACMPAALLTRVTLPTATGSLSQCPQALTGGSRRLRIKILVVAVAFLTRAIAKSLKMPSLRWALLVAAPVALATKMTWVSLGSKYPQAVCNDGSSAGYYWRAALPKALPVWLVFLEGGGWCYSQETCAKRSQDLTSSTGYPEQTDEEGIFNSSDPRLRDANLAFVKYCTSDAHTGAAPGPLFDSAPVFKGGMVRRRAAGGSLYCSLTTATLCSPPPSAERPRGPAGRLGRHGLARPRGRPRDRRPLRRLLGWRPRRALQLRRDGRARQGGARAGAWGQAGGSFRTDGAPGVPIHSS